MFFGYLRSYGAGLAVDLAARVPPVAIHLTRGQTKALRHIRPRRPATLGNHAIDRLRHAAMIGREQKKNKGKASCSQEAGPIRAARIV